MRSRIAGVLLLTAATALPVGLFASPAGAVGATTCKSANGVATFTPGLPKAGSPTKVKPTVLIKGAKVGGCVGGAVTAGTLSANLKFGNASNCSSVLAGAPGNVKGTVKIVWAAAKGTSTIAATLTGVKGKPTTQVVTGLVTVGKFKGSHLRATTLFTVPKDGSCSTKALTKVTFALVKGTKLTIK